MRRRCLLLGSIMLAGLSVSLVAEAQPAIETPAWQKVEGLGKKNSYAFLLFDDAKTEEGKKMRQTLEEAKQEIGGEKVDIVEVAPDDPREEPLVRFFGIQENPTVVAIAPSGAVTGYFPKTADKNALAKSLVSLKEAELLKDLQEGRVVFLCFQKDGSPNSSAVDGDLKAVAQNFKGNVNVVYVSSKDQGEEKLREKLKVASDAETTVFVVVPPGRASVKLAGSDITKSNLMRALLSSCGGGGCGPSGCR